MKDINFPQHERDRLSAWAGDLESLSDEQIIVCIALERLGGNVMPDEIAEYCGTTVEKIAELKKGIYEMFIDADTGRFWIK